FDHEWFYKWAMKQENIYISEYWMPEPFICIWEREKTQLLSGIGAGKKVVEKIYTVPHNDKRPLTMFDFIKSR
ncbi:MAG: hypothetical protein II574_11465, partial [Ruminococcus sp.]|nr:hypothetical protein [Ruminococcus sp.]